MVQVKEFFTILEFIEDYGWDISVSLEAQINEFLKDNPNIEIIDIKYVTHNTETCIQSTALVVYKEVKRQPYEKC